VFWGVDAAAVVVDADGIVGDAEDEDSKVDD
jgi:hypothetical protein